MKKLLTTAIIPLLVLFSLSAGEHAPVEKGWYIGVQGGMPFGVSTFSSFGNDKVHVGYSAGLYGGYRFNPVLSLEVNAKWGLSGLSAQDCCIDRHLWLGADGVSYNAPVLGMDGWEYDDLKSSVFVQQYGLQLNVNILGFADAAKRRRWTLEVSPVISAIGSKSTFMTVADGITAFENSTQWHLGAGGKFQIGYQLSEVLNIALYSGMTYLTGDGFDGMPSHIHQNNFLWENGLKIGFKI